ncbi:MULTISPECIES: hypothetical protein [unclassified Meiothermus]|uniref:hypothetical protein n=1 Tax=unclassified Meiothermus TaxID=370471 RepID=UPI000D7C7849|nr:MULTISPECIES: hypothetical protein [unclassified Meiothermus]PZA05807.1 hypothetical protein DNA98_16755 [Meiothermus sp. Pnk-1]RYM29963.1 hypothetical protein EWH23_15850 [Meiothermus sp. PNK-Is4]
MQRTLILFLALGLAACSGHTLTTVRVDALSYIPTASRSGQLDLTTATLLLPDDDGDSTYGNDPDGLALELPNLDILEQARLEARLSLKNTGSTPASVSLEVHVAPPGDGNIYDGNQDYTVASGSVNLSPGEEKPLELGSTLGETSPAFGLLKSGKFRLGLRVSLAGDTVSYTLEKANVSLSGRLFKLIPD